jgi:hypothetical protein
MPKCDDYLISDLWDEIGSTPASSPRQRDPGPRAFDLARQPGETHLDPAEVLGIVDVGYLSEGHPENPVGGSVKLAALQPNLATKQTQQVDARHQISSCLTSKFVR